MPSDHVTWLLAFTLWLPSSRMERMRVRLCAVSLSDIRVSERAVHRVSAQVCGGLKEVHTQVSGHP